MIKLILLLFFLSSSTVFAQGDGSGGGGGKGKNRHLNTRRANAPNPVIVDTIHEAEHDTILLNRRYKDISRLGPTQNYLAIAKLEELDSLYELSLSNTSDEKTQRALLDIGRKLTQLLGSIYYEVGNYPLAIEHWEASYQIKLRTDDRKGLSGPLLNIGLAHSELGDYEKALDYLNQALEIRKSMGKKKGVAMVLNNIANLYVTQGELEAAKEVQREALAMQHEVADSQGVAYTQARIADIYVLQDSNLLAEAYFQKALSGHFIKTRPRYYASFLSSFASFKLKLGKIEEAVHMFDQARSIQESIDNKQGLSFTHMSLSKAYFTLGKYDLAIKHGVISMELSQSMGLLNNLKGASENLYQSYKAIGNDMAALEAYELFLQTRDSLNRKENIKATLRQKYKYEYEKRAAADSVKAAQAAKIKDAELATERAENKRQRVIIYFIIALVVIVLFFVYMVLKSLKLVKVEKGKVDIAYEQLEEKNTEILDSISYAKRIQSAILPPQKVVKEYLPESFILYKPKDIVAGDFYWLEHVENKVLFAACDCTGHGVPGAMVSVVCNNGLNRAVREHGLTTPGSILTKTREIVINEFEKSEEEVKDGMDVALCSLEGNTLEYAGANNPLWIVRSGSNQIEEIKADKQPIGKYDTPLPYTTHTIKLNKGDSVYIFSDGYADQFGGDKGKKLKAKNFKELLLSLQREPMSAQRDRIDKAFNTWKGEFEQLDDVCVIGVRV